VRAGDSPAIHPTTRAPYPSAPLEGEHNEEDHAEKAELLEPGASPHEVIALLENLRDPLAEERYPERDVEVQGHEYTGEHVHQANGERDKPPRKAKCNAQGDNALLACRGDEVCEHQAAKEECAFVRHEEKAEKDVETPDNERDGEANEPFMEWNCFCRTDLEQRCLRGEVHGKHAGEPGAAG